MRIYNHHDIIPQYKPDMAKKEVKLKKNEARKWKRKEKENLWKSRSDKSDPIVVHYPKRSALQTLHKESGKARDSHFFEGGLNHDWVSYYERCITSDQSCVNEWYAMDSLESKRLPSPDSLTKKEETELLIRSKLKEIMMSVDIDEVTSKFIRQKLECQLSMDLFQYKSFIDQEMLTILGQMDSATEIFPHVYLGSEWNASNLEELKKNGVGYILNVTKEIDNFFPGMFDYLNIRVYDDEKTELLKHWEDTYKYISSAKNKNGKVLVHCKMGISRSASVVIAYAMKAKNMNLEDATQFVKSKRTCIKPNQAFMSQLKIYQGILDASRQRHNILWRSKSENNLKIKCISKKNHHRSTTNCRFQEHLSSSDIFSYRRKPKDQTDVKDFLTIPTLSRRPKSWSPDEDITSRLLFNIPQPDYDLGDNLTKSHSLNDQTWEAHVTVKQWDMKDPMDGELYQLSPVEAINNNVFFDKSPPQSPSVVEDVQLSTSVKDRITEFENVKDKTYKPSANDEFLETDSKEFVFPKNEKDCEESNRDTYFGSGEIEICVEPASEKGQEEVEDSNKTLVDATNKNVDHEANSPSRNSSWGSFDSAVFLADREAPSRQSSWGSCDTKFSNGSFLSRNSSCGAFDLKMTSDALRSSEKSSPSVIRRTRSNAKFYHNTDNSCTPIDKPKISSDHQSKASCKGVSEDKENLKIVRPPFTNHFVRSFSSGCVDLGRCYENKNLICRSYSEKIGKLDKTGKFNTFSGPGKVRKITKAIEAINNQSDKVLRQRSMSLDRLTCQRPSSHKNLRSSQTFLSKLVVQTEAQAKRLSDDNEVGVKILVNKFEANERLLPQSENVFSGFIRSARRKIRPRSENIGDKILPPVPQRKSSLDLHFKGARAIGTLRQSLSWSPSIKQSGGMMNFPSKSMPNKPPTAPAVRACGIEVRQKKQQGKTHPLSKLVSRENPL